ncbi:MAG TPA: hypothetical protein VM370_00250, partial [Candidatus Thermoplasmatota archaeon]|nr:hypothetical protein [Candidatus Thermoplasmatota archaeon]
MASQILAIGAGLFLGIAGAVVLAVGPSRSANRIAGPLLILWGAVTAATALTTGAPDERTASLYAHVNVWYSLPLPPLMVALLRSIVPAERFNDRVALAGATILSVAGAIAFAVRPSLFIQRVVSFDGQWGPTSAALLYAMGAFFAFTEAYVIVRIAHALRKDTLRPAPRTHAAMLALALALPLSHNGSFFVTFTAASPWPPVPPLVLVRSVGTVLALAVAVPAIVRVLREFPTRRLLATALAGVGILGLVDGVIFARVLQQIPYPGYATSLVVVRVL